MARPSASGPTDHEMMIIDILWQASPLSIAEILERFPRQPKPAYTSILTIVRNMEKKGYLRHKKDGKAFLYSPKLKQEDYKKSEIRKIADRLFGGNKFELAVNLIKEEKLGVVEIRQLKKLLEDL